ncbi:MAG: DUF2961 domain-containing protein [Phycisphaerales bacterium]
MRRTPLMLMVLNGGLSFAAGAAAQSGMLEGLAEVTGARSRRVSSASSDPASNYDNRHVKPGETLTIADIKGSGVIRHIWCTFPDSGKSWLSDVGSASPSEVVLRMYWDGAAEPAVESPVGDFFAAGFGRRAEITSAPVIVQGGDSYNCYWVMPFRTGARVTITNESAKPFTAFYYQVDYTEESVPPEAAYFCAQYRQEFPTRRGEDYLILDAESHASDDTPCVPGGGQYIGTVFSYRSRSPKWFGEGDEKFSIDGEARPSLWGTGTEDYFSNAWGLEKGCYPYFGVTQLDGDIEDIGASGTMYRWHLADPVRFSRSLRFTIEHAGWMSADETTTGRVEGFVEREDDFSSVAFWYQRGQPKRFTTLPSAAERRLPLIDTVIEGKDLLGRAVSEGGGLSLQDGSLWTGQGQIFFDNTAGQGAWVEFAFDLEHPASQRLIVPITHSYDFGVYTIRLDGDVVAENVDFYSPRVELHEQNLGDRPLAAGKHTIRLECTGRHASSTGWKIGIDSVRLRHRWNVKREPLQPTRRRPDEK